MFASARTTSITGAPFKYSDGTPRDRTARARAVEVELTSIDHTHGSCSSEDVVVIHKAIVFALGTRSRNGFAVTLVDFCVCNTQFLT
jgi:hypothetical protein